METVTNRNRKGGFDEFATVIYEGFDVVGINEDGPDDVEGLDGAAAHVANLLSNEPGDSKFSF